jgi:cysteine desulfurase
MKMPIYMDYASTTFVDEKVLEEMIPYFKTLYGNPSSRFHAYGWMAEEAIAESIQTVGDCLGCKGDTVLFTSGATESINLALKGFFEANPDKNHLISFKTEHKATLDVAEQLEKRGVFTSLLGVDEKGEIDLTEVEKSIMPSTGMISILWVNNETGLISPMQKLIAIAKKNGVLVHIDATQAVGKIAINFKEIGADLLSFSAHKIYGPKGVGALIKKKEIRLNSQIVGGGQQRKIRSGTLNVPGIVGLAKALSIATEKRVFENDRLRRIHDRMVDLLSKDFRNIKINGLQTDKVPHILNVCFMGADGEDLLNKLTEIAVSNGSACNSASTFPSHVLKAMHLSDADAYSSLRFSFGRATEETDIMTAINGLKRYFDL